MTADKIKLNDGKTDLIVIVAAYYRQQITLLEIAIKSWKYKNSSHNVVEKSGGHTRYKHDPAPTCQSDCGNNLFFPEVNK